MSSRRLLKFKYSEKSGDVYIKYERENPASSVRDEFTLRSCEAPRGELRTAMQNMAKHALEICELPQHFMLQVLGVSISYSDEDIQGLVITTHRPLKNSNAPMIVNTPHFSREPYSEPADPETSVFSSECGDDLDRLERLVFAYVDGERAQTELGLEETQEPEEPELVTL